MVPNVKKLSVSSGKSSAYCEEYLKLTAMMMEKDLTVKWGSTFHAISDQLINQISHFDVDFDAYGFLWYWKKWTEAINPFGDIGVDGEDNVNSDCRCIALQSLHLGFPGGIKLHGVLSAVTECIINNPCSQLKELKVILHSPTCIEIPFDLKKIRKFLKNLFFIKQNSYLESFTLRLDSIRTNISMSCTQIDVAEQMEKFDDNIFGVLKDFRDSSLKYLCLQLPLSLDNVPYLQTIAYSRDFNCDIVRDQCIKQLTITLRK